MITPLLPEDKLAVLRAADTRRKWSSLDDQRVCVLCDRVVTGREIAVTRSNDGIVSVHCPTPGCPAVPSDWFYQGTGHSSNAGTLRMGEVNIWGDSRASLG
jgi:hypothetical protein